MAIFHCKDSELIERVDITSPRVGITQATIIARESADPAKLQTLREHLTQAGCSSLMDVKNGCAVIQVRGISDVKHLEKTLLSSGSVPSIHIEATADDHITRSLGEKLSSNSLLLSALFYDLGNIAFIVSGIQRGRHNPGGRFTTNDYSEILTGAAFSVGDILMTIYGKDKGDEELAAARDGLSAHLEKKGIRPPEADVLSPDTLHQSGFVKHTSDWLRKNVVYGKCLSELAGGLFTIHAAMKPGNFNQGKMAAGMLITTGWTSTLLLDKPRGHEVFDGDKPDTSTLAGKLADNPRGLIARPLAMMNNVANLWGSLGGKDGERARFQQDVKAAERNYGNAPTAANQAALSLAKVKQHDYIWNVISAGAFLVAHSLFGLSGSKRPPATDEDNYMMNDLVLMSANMLAKQPEEVREAAIVQTADYVSHLSHITLSQDALEKVLRDKVESLTHSAWASRTPVGMDSSHSARM